MLPKDRREKEFKEGLMARITGQPITNNPYPQNRRSYPKHRLWEAGWTEEDRVRS